MESEGRACQGVIFRLDMGIKKYLKKWHLRRDVSEVGKMYRQNSRWKLAWQV